MAGSGAAAAEHGGHWTWGGNTCDTELVSTGSLTGGIRIPNTVGVLNVAADLRAGQVTCSVDIDAPREGRPTTRVNWLARQLKDAPDGIRVEAFAMHSRGASSAELLRDIRVDPARLLADPRKELRAFRVAMTSTMDPVG